MGSESVEMEWGEMRRQVFTVMSHDGLLQQLVQRLNAERRLSRRNENLETKSLTELLDIDEHIINSTRRLFSIFEGSVIAKLPTPVVITADDLQRLAFPHLAGMREQNASELLNRFISFVLREINEGTEGRHLDLGKWTPTKLPSEPENWPDWESICDLPNSFALYIVLDEREFECRAEGCLRCMGTENAINQLTSTVGPLVESLVRLLRLSVTAQEMAPAIRVELEWENLTVGLGDNDEVVTELHGPVDPPIHWLLSQHVILLIDSAMNCLITESPFACRIKNAMTFAHYADSHANEAISLSFCVSAIEALLCEGKEDIGAQLRTRIPALLQFQGNSKMRNRAGRAIGDLYTVRSECLHGSRTTATTQQLQAARRLTSAILRAALEWSIRDAAGGRIPTEEEWTAELRKAMGDGKTFGEVPGVTKDLSEHVGAFLQSFSLDDD